MSVNAVRVLSALRDIEGVLGSFVVDADGQMLARDLPQMFDPAALINASLHLSRLRAALASAGSGFDSCVARFGSHLLVLRALHEHTLCVLCPEGTNLPALQMSSSLIARRLLGALAGAQAIDPGEDELAARPPTRRFRGRNL